MIEIALMIEGQNGLNWPRWQNIVRVAEELGFAGIYRSDHYTNPNPPDMDSLELWVSLTWLAGHTTAIEFGPLVTPFSFRDPTMVARMAGAIDDLSGGRLTLGLGAGWQEREHTNYGWDLLDIPGRMARLEEGVQIVCHLLNSDEPLNFAGRYFHTKEAVLLPRPLRKGGPPILLGGNGIKRTLPMAARYAVEWNGVFLSPARFAKRNRLLDELLKQEGRQPSDLRRSVMVGTLYSEDPDDFKRRNPSWFKRDYTVEEMRELGFLVGTPDEIEVQIDDYEAAGAQRIMLQWLDLDDLDGLQQLASTLLS